MAKFRFPGKALKLNTRKRVRFRGSYPTNTPEELYTRRIRRGLDLFNKLFGESDEDEDEFEGFASSSTCKDTKSVPAAKVAEKKKKKVDEVCTTLEKEGLVRRTRTSAVAMAVKEVREGKEKKALVALDERTRVRTPESNDKEPSASVVPESAVAAPSLAPARQNKVPIVGHSAHKQTNCRVGRQPTVKTALAKKLLAKAKKKLPSLPVVGERSPKRFILPTMSARSSRIIKPNKRLFADITEMCSTSSSMELQANAQAAAAAAAAAESSSSLSLSSKRLVKLSRKGRGSHSRLFRGHGPGAVKGSEGVGRDRMKRTISLYTESITGTCRGQVGRPPKRLLRRMEAPQQPEVEAELPDSPQKCDAKESRVKEKIEKLLRSAWDDRLKQSGKAGKCDMDEMMPAPASSTSPALSASAISGNILRKARLNLNISTLQKIRNPASLQRLIPQSDEGEVEGRCIICDRDEGENTRKFSVIICEVCCSFVSSASDGPKEVFECVDSKGSCQVQGLVEEEDRCLACWLGRILQSCFMPNLLHDRLRKRLPPVLKEKIPTSLARCLNLGSWTAGEKVAELTGHTKRLPLDPGGAGGGGGAFGNVMDLPGGWRRKTGSEVIVISPCGEKFKSMQKLEEFLKNQGISADARVLFGNSSPVVGRTSEVKSRPTASSKNNERLRVVMTTLPGGWTRRIKWRFGGDRFDTYVNSPDGRTFRSKRELNAYFQQIGKIDDIHKYFPVVNGNSDSSTPSSSDTAGFSSTEPVSSSEIGSDISSDDKSPEGSEVECETPNTGALKLRTKKSKGKNNSSKSKSRSSFASPDTPSVKVDSPNTEDVGVSKDEMQTKKCPGRPSLTKTPEEKDHLGTKSSGRLSERAEASEEESNDVRVKDFSDKKTERKHKKSKGLRTRSLSVGSKQKESSLTDTTESESEQHRHSKEGSVFANTMGRSRSNTISALSEMGSSEKRGLCSAWNTILCDSGGEYDSEPYASKVPEERKLPLKSLNRKRKKATNDHELFAVPNIVPDIKTSSEKVVLKINKKSIVSPERNSKDKTREGGSSLLEQEKETSGVVSQASVTDSPTPPSPSFRKKQLSVGSREQLDDAVEEESPDTITESLTKAGDSVSRSEPKIVTNRLTSKVKTKLKKKKKTSMFQSVQFGNNWSRKIKWNDKGEGAVALLHSPDGQTIRSRIELLAYFKKAGRTKVDLDYYFPPDLKRSNFTSSVGTDSLALGSVDDATILAVVTEGSGHSSEPSDFSDGESFVKTSEDSSASTEDGRRRRRVISDYSKLGRTLDVSSSLVEEGIGRVTHLARPGKKVIVVTGKSGKIPIIKSDSEEGTVAVPDPGGPRVKHVCRSQAQVLGIQRAVFPSPEKEGRQDLDSLSPVMGGGGKKRRKREVVTVTQKGASGKILQKTMWCNKCTGCVTPNCQKCVNCLDMKKFGGPGTKKKPCIKRKCLNPRLSAKSVQSTMGQDRKFKKTVLPLSAAANESLEARDRSKSPAITEERLASKPDRKEEKADIIIRVSTQDKSAVFVPRQMTRVQPDQKDRGDIAAGKKFVPGALVNIDYWQGYDVDEMMLSGFSVTTSSPLYPQTLCFRCGSAGKERLTFCIWCCEGVHPFCMEDGEGPESDTEELFWMCRRCAVCHVCGAPGADSLLRCSDCRNYYHMECLGPSAHSTCQPNPDRPWEAEMLVHLRYSWPHQAVLYDADGCEDTGLVDPVVVHTQLDPLREADDDPGDSDFDEPDIHFLPLGDFQEKSAVEECERLSDTFDFELEDAICLEDSVIEVFRNVDLYKPQPSPTSNLHGEELFTLATEEYLCLGYKKLIEYASRKVEISYYRLLQIIHNELFDTLEYPTWREMLRKGLVEARPTGRGMDSDTDTASEGGSDSEDSEWDWEDVLEFRRFEASQEMQERDEKRLEKERREREIEREKVRLARRKESEKEGKLKDSTPGQKLKNGFNFNKKKKKRGRPPGTVNKVNGGSFDFIVPNDGLGDGPLPNGPETPKRIRFRQPKSWEEFDRLFFWKSKENGGVKVEETEEEKRVKKQRVLYSVKMNLGETGKLKTNKTLGREKMKVGGKASLKVLKKLKAVKKIEDRAKKLKDVKRKSKILKRVKENSGFPMKEENAKKKQLIVKESVPLTGRKKVTNAQKGNQDQPLKKKRGESLALLPKHKKQQGSMNSETVSDRIARVEEILLDVRETREDDDDAGESGSDVEEVNQKKAVENSVSKRGQGRGKQILQASGFKETKEGSDGKAVTNTKGVKVDGVKIGTTDDWGKTNKGPREIRDGKNGNWKSSIMKKSSENLASSQSHSRDSSVDKNEGVSQNAVDSQEDDIENVRCDDDDVQNLEDVGCKGNIENVRCVDDVQNLEDVKCKGIAKSSRRQTRVCLTASAGVSEESASYKEETARTLRPEEENSDKENHPSLKLPEKGLETGVVGSAKLMNGVREDSGVVSGDGEIDGEYFDNGAETSSLDSGESIAIANTCSAKKRKLSSTSCGQSRAKTDVVPKDKVRKLGDGQPELPKDEESPSLAIGRRRRSVGRASLLASQRKAMMDY